MKFNNYSVRKKLLLSNVLMVGVPVLLVLLAMSAMLFALMYTTQVSGRLAGEGGSVYEVQYLFDSICGDLSHESGGVIDGELTDAFAELEHGGATIYVGGDAGTWYVTPGQSLPGLQAEARAIAGGAAAGDAYFFRAGTGLAYQTVLHDANGNRVTFAAVSRSMAWQEGEFQLLTGVKRTIKTGVAVTGGLMILIIVGTGALLTRKLAKSILQPVGLLRCATARVGDGDLATPMPPASLDELGDVCRAFDGMRERLQASEAERASYEQNRRELIAGISHDLRTPLTSIEGYLSGLRDGVANTPEKQAHYVDTALETAKGMDRLVDDLFLLSKLDAGGLAFRLEPVNLAAYFADFCAERRDALTRQGVALTFEADGKPARAALDRAQFARVVQNLVSNSVKYRKPAGGTLAISLRRTDDTLCLSFADTGRGVAAADTDKIFDSFYRTDPARANVKQGSGLGLAITKQLVLGMGGRIGATGATDAGLTVWMEFPAYRREGDA